MSSPRSAFLQVGPGAAPVVDGSDANAAIAPVHMLPLVTNALKGVAP